MMKRSNHTFGDVSGSDKPMPSFGAPIAGGNHSQPLFKKSKLTNRFSDLGEFPTDATPNACTSKSSAFLKPSKLDWGAKSVFQTVKQIPAPSSADTATPSEQFLTLTRPNLTLNKDSLISAPSDDRVKATNAEEKSAAKSLEAHKLTNTSDEGKNSNSSISAAGKDCRSSESVTVRPKAEETEEDKSENQNLEKEAENKPVFGEFAAASSFTFGQHLQDRVVSPVPSTSEAGAEKRDKTFTNGPDAQHSKSNSETSKPLTLFSSSNGQQASKMAAPTQFKTGEEHEKTVFQMQAKLFQFDSVGKNWKERGQGLLKLNEDSAGATGRLVMRTSATLLLILNTKLFSGQLIERASEKTIRISCLNDDQTGLTMFLIKGEAQNITTLDNLLQTRVAEHEKD